MKITKILATAAAVALLPIAGAAATLSLSGGTGGVPIPSDFGKLRDVNGLVGTPADLSAPITVFDNDDVAGTGLYVSSSNLVRVTLTYVGYEAANTNTASTLAAGSAAFSTATSVKGDTITFSQAGGAGTLVDLIFSALANKGGTPCSFANGASFGTTCQVGFSNIFAGGHSTYAMFGDGLGDSDLDDIVFRVDVSEVPVPAAGFLLVGGLGAMAALRRRKKA
ncbi:MAG: VPLPA-CTERM sorting domain-containing protein [Pseudomonadota bacterium]|nr:VPLPA-CTERM sorting domain-containing protein [Pseudomonadota bacterium]